MPIEYDLNDKGIFKSMNRKNWEETGTKVGVLCRFLRDSSLKGAISLENKGVDGGGLKDLWERLSRPSEPQYKDPKLGVRSGKWTDCGNHFVPNKED